MKFSNQYKNNKSQPQQEQAERAPASFIDSKDRSMTFFDRGHEGQSAASTREREGDSAAER